MRDYNMIIYTKDIIYSYIYKNSLIFLIIILKFLSLNDEINMN